MKFAALIPARGGSRRIPRKNLQLIAGRTLVAIAIDTAREAGLPAYVSTDDAAIRYATTVLGAGCIERPAELATDHSSTEDVIAHALRRQAERRAAVLYDMTRDTRFRIQQIKSARLAARAARLFRAWGDRAAADFAHMKKVDLQIAMRGGRARYNHQ